MTGHNQTNRPEVHCTGSWEKHRHPFTNECLLWSLESSQLSAVVSCVRFSCQICICRLCSLPLLLPRRWCSIQPLFNFQGPTGGDQHRLLYNKGVRCECVCVCLYDMLPSFWCCSLNASQVFSNSEDDVADATTAADNAQWYSTANVLNIDFYGTEIKSFISYTRRKRRSGNNKYSTNLHLKTNSKCLKLSSNK